MKTTGSLTLRAKYISCVTISSVQSTLFSPMVPFKTMAQIEKILEMMSWELGVGSREI
jgi:hypothetical protein